MPLPPPLYNHRVGPKARRGSPHKVGTGDKVLKCQLVFTIIVPRLDLNLVQILRHLLGGGGGYAKC